MGKKNVDIDDAWFMGQPFMKKICLVCPDDLSTIIFAKSFGLILKDNQEVTLHTIAPFTVFEKELKQVNSLHTPLPMERFINVFADIKYFFALLRIFRREQFDAIITFTTKPNIYACPAARLAGIKKIAVAVRGMGRIFETSTNLKDRVIHFIVSHLYKNSFNSGSFVWFTNPNDRQYCLDKNMVTPEKTVLTPNAINVNDFSTEAVPAGKIETLRKEFGIGADESVVIMVARLVWSKGIREFAEAAVLLRDRFPMLKFLLVAPEEPDSPVGVPISFIKDMQAQSNLIWINFRKDIRDVYALADLAVLPSYYKEGGYPRALLEPMGLGKPVIAADTPDCKAPVEEGKNGYLVPVKDAGKLADCISRIISDPCRMKFFGKHSRKLVLEKYDDTLVAKTILKELSII